MAMSSSSSTGGMQATPNVTPMIDVMLVLLIIFMVVTPQLLAGFNADPPKAINLKDHPEDPDQDHVLGIDKDGHYYLDKKPYAADQVPGLRRAATCVRGSPPPSRPPPRWAWSRWPSPAACRPARSRHRRRRNRCPPARSRRASRCSC